MPEVANGINDASGELESDWEYEYASDEYEVCSTLEHVHTC
jgi:hypothetical protein